MAVSAAIYTPTVEWTPVGHASAKPRRRRPKPKPLAPAPLAPAPLVPSRTRRRAVVAGVVAALAVWAVADHARQFRRGGDDWGRYDHRRVTVVAVPAGDELDVRSGDGPPEAVHLTGLLAPPRGGRGADDARRFLSAAAGPTVTLLLETPATRDAAGRVRAYAYAADGSCLNVDLVKAGWATVDRRSPGPFDGLLRPAEADARRHGRGVWSGDVLGPTPTSQSNRPPG